MRRSSCVVLRPVSCILILMLVVLFSSSLSITLWIFRSKTINNEVNLTVNRTNHELVYGVEKTIELFSPINASTINLARVLSQSLDEKKLQFSQIKFKVAPRLFQALSTVPYLSQVSYIRSDGLLFAYYNKGDQPFALYSNSTFSSNQTGTNGYSWYMQPVNQSLGKLYGEAVRFPPSAVINSSWYQSALNSTNVSASVETGWGDSQDFVLLTTAGMGGRGAISLGLPVKSLVDFCISGISFYNGSLILATNDGNLLTKGIPNTRMILVGDQVSFQLLGTNGDRVGEVGNVTCQRNEGSLSDSIFTIWGSKYLIKCSHIEISGLQLVYVMALPYNKLPTLIHLNAIIAFVLLIIMIGSMIITICAFVYLMFVAARREMYLCGALIKQMEATQQAERKSMNKSLAFASASHDVRASLAGLTGLIQLSRDIVPKRDPLGPELQTNLLQMEGCAMDLLGILNSILDTSKIEAGKMQLEEEDFYIEQLLEDVADLFHPVGMRKGVDVILDPYDGSVMKSSRVKGDRRKLKQILSNLLSNAVKFTSEGHVAVRAWARKPTLENEILASNRRNSMSFPWCLFFQIDKEYSESEGVKNIRHDPNCMEFIFEVNDTGKGIPKEQHESVFENYVQVKGTALGQEGTGLGLGIVQSLVRLMGGEIGIVDKEVGERGTCFRFNAFFSICETDISTNAREEEIEAHDDYIATDSFQQSGPMVCAQSPKSEASQVILFIESEKRRSILQNFMERHDMKVHIVEQHQQLSPTLKKVKQKLNLSRFSSSSKSDINSRCDCPMSCASSMRSSKELPLSALDGVDNVIPSQRLNARGGLVSFILIVIETSAGPFREISRTVAEFRKDLNINCCSRVVWLDKPGSENTNFHGLDEDKLPPSDMMIYKPFHGSRLYQAIGILPEFRGMPLPRRGEETQNLENVYSLEEASTSGLHNKNSLEGNSLAEIVENQTGEIEEVEVPSNSKTKPLTGKKILVADDDPVGLRIATSVAARLGAKTSSCKNGKEALQLICQSLKDGTNAGSSNKSLPFDCILMDCEMPEMNGIEASRRIREEEEYYGIRIPIIALTAHKRGEEVDMMIEAGVDDFLTKPLGRENLLKAMSKLT